MMCANERSPLFSYDSIDMSSEWAIVPCMLVRLVNLPECPRISFRANVVKCDEYLQSMHARECSDACCALQTWSSPMHTNDCCVISIYTGVRHQSGQKTLSYLFSVLDVYECFSLWCFTSTAAAAHPAQWLHAWASWLNTPRFEQKRE